MTVSFSDCCDELLFKGNTQCQNSYNYWTRRPEIRAEVVPFVEGFTHSFLFRATRADYEAVVSTSGHALGNVQTSEQIREVEDFFTPFAFQHLFHDYIETYQQLPTWEQFAQFMKGPAKPRYIQQVFNHFGFDAMNADDKYKLGRAIHWRLGKFYYSAMREIELMIRLREEHGIHLKYHLLADVLLRVDYWVDNVLLCVWFGNPMYRSQSAGGRKIKAATFFDAQDFTIMDIEVERQGHGNFWRVSDKSVANIAQTVQAALRQVVQPE